MNKREKEINSLKDVHIEMTKYFLLAYFTVCCNYRCIFKNIINLSNLSILPTNHPSIYPLSPEIIPSPNLCLSSLCTFYTITIIGDIYINNIQYHLVFSTLHMYARMVIIHLVLFFLTITFPFSVPLSTINFFFLKFSMIIHTKMHIQSL